MLGNLIDVSPLIGGGHNVCKETARKRDKERKEDPKRDSRQGGGSDRTEENGKEDRRTEPESDVEDSEREVQGQAGDLPAPLRGGVQSPTAVLFATGFSPTWKVVTILALTILSPCPYSKRR